MNLRALTKGDAAVAGAAVLLLISSFLPYYSVCLLNSCQSNSAWDTSLFPVLPSIYLLGIAAAALILLQRFQGEAAKTRQILGLRLDQWGTAFSVAALWTAIWALGGGGSAVSHSIGAYLGLLATLVLAGAAVAGPLLPVLQTPLLSDKPAAPAQVGYPGATGGYPGGPQQTGYGYPGMPGANQGQAQGQANGQTFGGQPVPGGYGYPAPGQESPFAQPTPAQENPFAQPAPAQESPFAQPAQAQENPFAQPTPAPENPFTQPAAQAQPAASTPEPAPAAAEPEAARPADFAPFWFAVPVPRQLTPKDGTPGPAVGELLPGTWYLAVDQRGSALVAQLQDGTQGLLTDTSGIQRG
ncbi:hypothetical protein ACIGXM_31480 [Kitasatospora sp. NPDC052896]|uniref:hypothetical protein n=1 Tax=Kitasatospora sp. NPDC052896 TaxID=3364061 RepID=UPI0037C5A698